MNTPRQFPTGMSHTNWQEFRCQTVPTNAASIPRLVSTSPVGADAQVTRQSVYGVNAVSI